jgi:choline monooxygenase
MDLRTEVLAFDPEIPIGRARTPPPTWYVDPAFDRLDRAAVFRRTWQVACRTEEVATPGAYVAGRAFGLSWVVVRGDDGVLRAFANSCRHKATEVCAGSGTLPHLTCPYHGWTYRLDGSLRTAPRMAGLEALNRAEMALPALGVQSWGPLVLIHADPAAPFPDLRSLTTALDATGWTGLRWHGRRTWEVACNWKAYCDNYLDGGYHVAHVHPSLAAQLDLEAYRTELFDTFNIQSCPSGEGGVAGRTEGGALYAWIYPNLMLNRYGPCLDTNVVHPISERRCRVTFDFWFDPEQVDEQWVAASLADSEQTQLEDMDVSERVQVGMETGTWPNGPYAPKVEMAIHHFHRLLASDLRRATEGSTR